MIAIIPARGGSKGLPGKNIKPMNGKPLIAYTIEAAIKSKNIDRVIISTDDEEIAEVSRQFGGEIPFMRPAKLATDTASSIDVFKYTLERLEKDEDIKIDDFIVLQPTSPLRTAKHIDEAIDMFYEKKANAVVGYCREAHPIFWHKYIGDNGKVSNIFTGDYYGKNRQEIRTTYYPNGALFVFNREYIFNNDDYSVDCYPYIMDRIFSIDIDTIDDFRYAEFIINL